MRRKSMRHSRRAADLFIAFAVVASAIAVTAFGAASATAVAVGIPVSTASGVRTAAVTAASSASDQLIAAQNNLASLEARAQQARRRYAAALAREHDAAEAVTASERQSKAAQAVAARARGQLGLLVASAYRSGMSSSLNSLTLVLHARDADDYLHGIQQTQRVVVNGDEVLDHANAASRQAEAAQQRAATILATFTATKNLVARSTVEATEAVAAASADFDALGERLDGLLQQVPADLGEPPDRTHPDPGAGPSAPPRPYDADLADRAVDFALAQIGKPYVWGATGPFSFDCSGLTMRAYEAAGVALPHFAAFQYAHSHPVAFGQLQPGDLLFWATDQRNPSTIYHEALYLGGGLMVQAPKSHRKISVASMWMWGPIQFYARPY